MPFHSISFLFFLALLASLYYGLPHRYRWMLLLGGSYFFYGSWRPGYLPVLLGLTLVNYYIVLRMGSQEVKSRRQKYLILCLIANMGLLFVFKYLNFLGQSLKTLFGHPFLLFSVPTMDILLPIGMSFYVFKNLSYAIEVYRGNQEPERHLGIYALYVSFFPQVTAGPIERSTRLIPQFHDRVEFDEGRVTEGLRFILWGIFLKTVVADNLGSLVDPVYDHPSLYGGLPLLIATLFFTFQIYCDFSGYSYIAIGAAEVMGFRTMDNFNYPYLSRSVAEFWRRWHISLSSWFRDYLYIPLGGNRVSASRRYFNIFVVLLLCGLWHGANWTFVVWGGIHGLYLVAALVTRGLRDRIHQVTRLNRAPRIHEALKVLTTFLLVCFAWIFFRANRLSDALYIVSHLFAGWGSVAGQGGTRRAAVSMNLRFELAVAIGSILLLLGIALLQRRGDVWKELAEKPAWIRWSVYYGLIVAIFLVGNFRASQFIYFQF